MASNHWREVRLKDVCVGFFDGPHATPLKSATGPVFLGISSLSNGRLNLAETEHVSEENFVKWTRRVIPKEYDLVFSYETRLGEAALIPPGLRCCLGRRLALMRPDRSKIDARFLLYHYISPQFQDFLKSRTIHGSTVDRIPLSQVPDFPIPLPALDEQRAIARILGTLDDKIELNRRMNQTLEGLARAAFEKWYAKNESMATTITVQQLIDHEIITIGDGYRAKRSELAEIGVPFARAGNLNRGFDFADAEFLGDNGVVAAREKIARDFDAVFTSKGTVGRIAQVLPNTPRFVYSPQLCFWRVLNAKELSPHVLFQWMNGSEFREQLEALKCQTDMADYVSLRDQRDMEITLPYSADSGRIAEQLHALALRIGVNQEQSRTLTDLRDALLPRLLSGELRVKQAERAVENAV